jgi:hypothetical protein
MDLPEAHEGSQQVPLQDEAGVKGSGHEGAMVDANLCPLGSCLQ